MAQGIRRIHESVDYDEMTRLYPPPPEYFEARHYEPRETIEARQLARLQDRALRAYQVPFFRARWDAAGFDPRSIRSLEDLWRAPAYTVDDIRKSIEANPPLGDYQGIRIEDARREGDLLILRFRRRDRLAERTTTAEVIYADAGDLEAEALEAGLRLRERVVLPEDDRYSESVILGLAR